MVDAAVLVAVGEGDDGELRVILVRRAEWGPHGGQIAFPGGKREGHDPSLEHTALREAHEEIGLEPDAVGPLEALPIVEVQATQFRIHPFLGRAIAGPMAGRELVRLRVRQEPFGVWIGREPLSKVLARPLPRRIDYRYSPYSSYWISETVPFPVEAKDDRYHPKEVVLGVEVKGVTRAYLGSVLTALGGRIVDEIEGHKIRIAYESEVGSFIWEAPEAVEVSDAYWFSWKAFHPETQIWSASDSELTP